MTDDENPLPGYRGYFPPHGQDTARKGACFPNCIFPVPSSDSGDVSLRAGLADLTALFQAELFCDFSFGGKKRWGGGKGLRVALPSAG